VLSRLHCPESSSSSLPASLSSICVRRWPLAPASHPASSGSQQWWRMLGHPSGVTCFEGVRWTVSGEVAGIRGIGCLPCRYPSRHLSGVVLDPNEPLTSHLNVEEGLDGQHASSLYIERVI
jgi:hypothetical protein